MADNMEAVTGGVADNPAEPVQVSTIYINNLEEREKIEDMIVILKALFAKYGNIVDVIMKKSLKRKGQAFLVFESPQEARAALIMDKFTMHGKAMNVAMARSLSDATVKRRAPTKFDEHKKHRTILKKQKEVAEAKEAMNKPQAAADKPRIKTGAQAVPSQFVPPNKTIVLEDLPADADQEMLTALFDRFEGFKELRFVKFRNMGFVEFADASFAIAAKENMAGQPIGAEQKPLLVSYQRT
ncbi:U2 small nuclear ribonucleoprotein B [Polyplosphaeria fusca]|uniref:U2 small nuclear ribonucleoprotein B n=1 Tax=Polyplosphaeria fusca TaxID=682080 RepID=A0A9P4V5S3_9PLEO|nr:U2 small nuclear ribonucleoprotein B [Polyplosphaeria fusca]